ncbi:MAG: 50S ribosomal protein L5 [Candidatus Omnitrophica bacterium]|nr:50S ribosomal protein L5 [Candidatus Omnitrophota bacterium]MDD5500940.1 50S ribosomal protein L5 [Candidatus Omnitrophota bacterium]
MIPRLLERYRSEIAPKLMEDFKIKNKMAVPAVMKVVVNMGIGEGTQDIKILEKAAEELGNITGQKPVIRRSKKAIANFKVRQGQPVGVKVTLRKTIMYEFMDRLFNIALPRIRDFRGVPRTSFDKANNYTLGLSEQIIFPEIEYDKITRTQGMDITFVIKNAVSTDQAIGLLKYLGMPFKDKE